MTQLEQQKLAAEIATQAENAVTDWALVPELVDYTYTPEATATDAKRKPAPLTFDELVAKYSALKDEVEVRELRMKDIKQALEAAVLMSGKKKVACGGQRLAIIEKAGSRSIKAEKLVAQGVSPEVIAKATVVGQGSMYLDIRRAKEQE